jgi:4-alpha-glucanotransferase
MPDDVAFALVLNLHQPAGNLEHLLVDDDWAAKEILWAIDRIPRSLWRHEDTARVHLALSGTLLATLADPEFQRRAYGIVDCGSLLWYLQNTRVIDVLGTAYYHPVLPLIPPADWDEQLSRWQGLGQHLFHRDRFHGFWPPEMGFCMELIPTLTRLGYRYVLVDSDHVAPVTPMRWEELRYRPHLARFGGEELVVVVRDRELSDAQEAGMDAGWFVHEVHERTKFCDFPPLVTTCTDGDNGGWFRNAAPEGNFWTVFHHELLERVKNGWNSGICPTFIHDYLDRHGPHGEVTIRPGAWNTGWHHGSGFTQWTGSHAQRAALDRVAVTSQAVHAARQDAVPAGPQHPAVEAAMTATLRAETSCNFYWGEAWVDRCHSDLDNATHHLESAQPPRR